MSLKSAEREHLDPNDPGSWKDLKHGNQQYGTLEELDHERKVQIAQNLRQILHRIWELSPPQGGTGKRQPRLVAVSKTFPLRDLQAAYDAGQRHFGENYIQELLEKSQQLPRDVLWHFIGTLQSNKIKQLTSIPNLALVESVDSQKKASLLNQHWMGPEALPIYIQINTSKETNKGGIESSQVLQLATFILHHCPRLLLAGLMTIGSQEATLQQHANLETGQGQDQTINLDFQRLVQCRTLLHQQLNLSNLDLSMGMSADFEQAVLANYSLTISSLSYLTSG